MKSIAALVLALPLAAGAAVTPEALRVSAERSFGGLIPVSDPDVAPDLPPGAPIGEPLDPSDPPLDPAKPIEPVLRQPSLESVLTPSGAPLGAMPLSRLDAHKALLHLRLGESDWDVSLAASPKFDVQYFAFRQGDRLVLARINNVNDLRKDGVVARLDDRTAYRFKVNINIFSPVRGSTLKIDPEPGTSGPRYSMKTGALLDAVKANSYVLQAGGQELWLLYGTDVDPATDRPAATRSFLFIHEAGLSSKAWPVAETALPLDAPTAVSLDQTSLVATRASDGYLRLNAPGGGAPSAR